MKNRVIFALTIICAILILSLVWGWGTYGDAISENKDLKNQVATLELAQTDWQTSQADLVKAQRLVVKKLNQKINEQERLITELQKQLAEQARGGWGGADLKDFPDMATLLHFLADDNTDQKEYIRSPDEGEAYVCEHFSFQLMASASEEGYRLYPILIFSYSNNRIIAKHMMCFAIVEKYISGSGTHKFIVAIEPLTDETVIVGRLHDVESWIEKWYRFLP